MTRKRKSRPSTNGANGPGSVAVANGRDQGGRLPDGRFAEGNPGGPGNPHVKSVAAWRNALIGAVTPEDIATVTAKLVTKAKAGEPWAVRELLDRCLGRPQQKMELEATGEKTWAAMLASLRAIDGKDQEAKE